MLPQAPVSQASARQRAGRAGRTQPGCCYRLYTEASFHALPLTTPPEIQRASLAWPVLQLKALGVDDVLHFDFVSPPSVASMLHGLEILYSLGALDDQCRLTPEGEVRPIMWNRQYEELGVCRLGRKIRKLSIKTNPRLLFSLPFSSPHFISLILSVLCNRYYRLDHLLLYFFFRSWRSFLWSLAWPR